MFTKFKLSSSSINKTSISTTGHLLGGSSSFSTRKFQGPLPLDVVSEPMFQYGGYSYDLARGKYNLSWDSMEAMQIWLLKEQEDKLVELRLKEVKRDNTGVKGWKAKHCYVCARQGTGGESKYEKKNPEWGRKVPTKRSGCACRLVVKTYPNTSKV